jgi:acetylornithine deacetylase/succinyl-diaminopimelate desuccinylase-like protein
VKEIVSYINAHQEDFIAALKDCLRIPSISVSKAHAQDVARCADFLAKRLLDLGLTRSEVFPTKRHPIVYGEWLGAPGKPTVLVYGHYDVQPVDPLNEWVNPPFDPAIRKGDLYARGAIDDKGQVYIHLGAIESFLKVRGRLPINLKIFLEGEEEIGSPNLEDFLKTYLHLLKADVVIISDTPMLDRGIPSICYGLRGLCYMEIEVSGPKQDLHSGVLGGIVDNPVHILAQILSRLKDKNGKVLVPGFYKDVRPIPSHERKMLAKLPISEKRIQGITGCPKLTGEKGYRMLERMWARPTLDVNGIFGGFSGDGTKTIIPAKASAKVSMRLVPDQDPDEIAKNFKRYVEKIAPSTVRVRVIKHHGSEAFLEKIDHPVFECTKRALEKAFGKKAHFIREGGSIPFVNTISQALKKPCILLGFGLPDENAHAPNERLNLENFHKGILSVAHLYHEISSAF